jgi:carboxyl-terminal processing protease
MMPGCTSASRFSYGSVLRTFVALAAATLFGALSLLAAPAPVLAQASVVAIPTAAITPPDVADILSRGAAFEREARWGEALTHFEAASRKYPSVTELKQRAALARVHYDLGRRYSDSSYLSDLTGLRSEQAVAEYEEILAKIESHYVHEPDWSEIVRRGVVNLQVALAEPAFVKRHLARKNPADIERLRQDVARISDYTRVQTTRGARNAAVITANEAYRRIGLSPTATVLEFTAGAVGGLDSYSAFLTAAQLDDLYSQIEGNFVGMGVELKSDAGSLLIVNTLAGSPAEEAGIVAGDRITAVEGKTTHEISTDRAADMLKGEAGTWVGVTVQSANGSVRNLRVERRRVEVPSVQDVKIVDADYGIGYLRINSFQKTTSRDVDAALWQLHRQGMRSLIIDVRGNPGGLLTSSVEVADKFLTEGMIVSTRGRSAQEDFDYRAHEVGTWRPPLTVLIDGNTASAAEIFSGAIADQQRGAVMGDRSYGKGSVQGIFPLKNQRHGVRLTTAKFYSPSGRAISDRGVTPNVPVTRAAKPLSDGATAANRVTFGNPASDEVLVAAVQRARQQLAGR